MYGVQHMNIRQYPRLLPWLLGGLALAFLPTVTNEYNQYIVNLVIVYAIVGTGFNIVVGYLGQLAFANAALFGIGAYTAGILMARLDVPFLAAVLAAGVFGAIGGAMVSVPALRGVRAFYLAIVTMAFGELMRFVYIHAEFLTEGSTGLQVPVPDVAGISLQSQVALYYVLVPIAAALLFATRCLVKSRVGRAVVAIHNNELAAATLAIPTSRYIVFAFAWSGFVVGVAGSMFAVLIGRVVPESFNLAQLILHFAIVMIGGIGTLVGPILGAVVLTSTPELFRGFPGVDEIVFGTLLVIVLVFMPGGLAGLFSRLRSSWIERLYRE